MKKFIFNIIVLTLGVVMMYSTARAGESFFDTVLDQTISSSIAGKTVNLQGYKDCAFLAYFNGGVANANKSFTVEIYNNNISVVQETVHLNSQGIAVLSKVYAVYAPSVGLAVYSPPANLKTKITVYAAH
ncbi:MAG: hypothetical protein FDX18_01760 [Chlorobium sp.]|nr:MAG: hypothetical protein FDX18_01760 [Chlorobium sp.]